MWTLNKCILDLACKAEQSCIHIPCLQAETKQWINTVQKQSLALQFSQNLVFIYLRLNKTNKIPDLNTLQMA